VFAINKLYIVCQVDAIDSCTWY